MSLFELVCAVTLVAVLLSVAVPSYARYRERVHSAQAATDIAGDFDLYSYGPDGQSKQQLDNKVSRDDVVRASDGAFIGIAADFGS